MEMLLSFYTLWVGDMPYNLETKCVFMENGRDEKTGAVNVPIYQTAGFSHPDPNHLEALFSGTEFGYVYSRISNPTIVELERRVAHLESGLGSVSVASGLAAILGVSMVLAQPNKTIVVSNSLFGGTRDLFEQTVPKFGVTIRFVDMSNHQEVSDAIDANTAFVFAEIISNPRLIVPDISFVQSLTKQYHIPLVIDATLTGIVGFNAKKHGVDVLIHSSTKLLASNNGAIGGLVVDTGRFDFRNYQHPDIKQAAKTAQRFAFLKVFRQHMLNNSGCGSAPFNAFQTMLGLETLHIRYERICQNALALAKFFDSESMNVQYLGLSHHANHSMANQLFQHGYGPLMTIDLGSKEAAFRMISNLKIVHNMSNLGDNRTMVIHPKSTIYSGHTDDQLRQAGVTDGLVRINVGIEHIDDIINDFKGAMA